MNDEENVQNYLIIKYKFSYSRLYLFMQDRSMIYYLPLVYNAKVKVNMFYMD